MVPVPFNAIRHRNDLGPDRVAHLVAALQAAGFSYVPVLASNGDEDLPVGGLCSNGGVRRRRPSLRTADRPPIRSIVNWIKTSVDVEFRHENGCRLIFKKCRTNSLVLDILSSEGRGFQLSIAQFKADDAVRRPDNNGLIRLPLRLLSEVVEWGATLNIERVPQPVPVVGLLPMRRPRDPQGYDEELSSQIPFPAHLSPEGVTLGWGDVEHSPTQPRMPEKIAAPTERVAGAW